MDEETRQAFAELVRLMNNQHERLIGRIAVLEQDFQNTKGFLVGDSLVAGRRWLDLDERVSRLERER